MQTLTGLEIELQLKETCKISCCDKKEKAKETGLLLSSEDTSYLEQEVLIKDEGNCKSGCCDGEIQTAAVTIVDCNSGCCENKGTVKQCHEKAALDMETGVSCDVKLVCCGNKDGEVGEQSHLEINNEEHCKSGCCSEEKQTEEITVASEEETGNHDHSSGCCVNEGTVKQSFHGKKHAVLVKEEGLDMATGVCCDPKLVCCGNTEGEVREKCDVEIKIDGHCKSSCCGDEKEETGEITLASEEEKDSTDCSSGCCVDKEEVTQLCHEKPVSSVVSGLEIEGGDDCKSHCCGTGLKQEESSNLANVKSGQPVSSCCSNDQETVKVFSQSCCKSPTDLQVKKDEHCESSERAVKAEICCKVKTPEACKLICREREKRHIGKSCCRSYAKEFCSHNHRHHHHHHHHHHHVSA